jgi:hypothetical protein
MAHRKKRARVGVADFAFFSFPPVSPPPFLKTHFLQEGKKNKNKNFFFFSVIGRENIRQYYEESVSYK